MGPLIMVSTTGARRSKADHPALPVTLDEILAEARACHAAGARAIHLHVRDAEGRHSIDPGRYREALAALADAVPAMAAQITTEAGGRYGVAEQLDCLTRAGAPWASISVREIARDPELADAVYGSAEAMGTRVQHILYDAGDAALLARLQAEGIVRPTQTDRILVLGRYVPPRDGRPEDLDAFPAGLFGAGSMVCAFGAHEHGCLAAAAKRGCDLRVGFENSLTNAAGETWASNAESVCALRKALAGMVASTDSSPGAPSAAAPEPKV